MSSVKIRAHEDFVRRIDSWREDVGKLIGKKPSRTKATKMIMMPEITLRQPSKVTLNVVSRKKKVKGKAMKI